MDATSTVGTPPWTVSIREGQAGRTAWTVPHPQRLPGQGPFVDRVGASRGALAGGDRRAATSAMGGTNRVGRG